MIASGSGIPAAADIANIIEVTAARTKELRSIRFLSAQVDVDVRVVRTGAPNGVLDRAQLARSYMQRVQRLCQISLTLIFEIKRVANDVIESNSIQPICRWSKNSAGTARSRDTLRAPLLLRRAELDFFRPWHSKVIVRRVAFIASLCAG